ncbi:uncharacterized protein LOC141663959 [Apium graveolens]|uniref:uncharacterized protein LOC141663959 n=1 Tax=Apium graveolens TaxID=4045 RepID=UPI003D79DF6E
MKREMRWSWICPLRWAEALREISGRLGFMKGTLQGSFGCKKIVNGRQNLFLSAKKFELNCLRDKEMDVKASSLDEYVKASASASTSTSALDSTIILFSFDKYTSLPDSYLQAA